MKTIALEVNESYVNKLTGKQSRHNNICKLMNCYGQFNNTPITLKEQTLSTSKCESHLSTYDINNAVVVFTDTLNIAHGSDGHVDLYRLLQAYLLDKDKRKEINKII